MFSSTATNAPVRPSSAVTTRILAGFDDPSFGREQWMKMLQQGDTNTVNLTWDWQRSWWKSFGKGELLLVLAEKNGQPAALAPLFAADGMIFNICPEDCLDFIGDIGDPCLLDALLVTAMESVPGFAGFRFYFIPDSSRTGRLLENTAIRLDLTSYDEGCLPSPALDLAGQPDRALEMTRKKSLRRHENYFIREGGLEVLHLREGKEILPHLEDFFEQHIARRAATSQPSIFLDERQKEYYRRLTTDISPAGWLRFTRISRHDRPIAFHYGLSYQGRYLFGIPSFDIALAAHSPGEVLLRQVLLSAIEEGASLFDFGIGDEAYKYRFSTQVVQLHTWGLYPTKTPR